MQLANHYQWYERSSGAAILARRSGTACVRFRYVVEQAYGLSALVATASMRGFPSSSHVLGGHVLAEERFTRIAPATCRCH